MRRRRNARHNLQRVVRALPERTQRAMLIGLEAHRGRIMVGAYVDRDGGACPMLAAHRCGGRTDMIAFARAWDRFTHAKKPRRATDEEVATLRALLSAELVAKDLPSAAGELGAAIAEHQRAARERREREARGLGLDWMVVDDEQSGQAPAPAAEVLPVG